MGFVCMLFAQVQGIFDQFIRWIYHATRSTEKAREKTNLAAKQEKLRYHESNDDTDVAKHPYKIENPSYKTNLMSHVQDEGQQ